MSKYNLDKNQIYDWYINQNLTQEEICKKLGGIPKITLQRFLRKNEIKKLESIDYEYLVPEIKVRLDLGMIHKDIAEDLGLTVDKIRKIIYQKINPTDNPRYSNKLLDESWINKNNPIFWYILGLISSDGHVDKNNNINIFQSNFEYLKMIQKVINHPGKLYKKENSECYTLIINSEKLYKILTEKYNITYDKRYSVPFINPPKELINHYIRGLFDGDGCLYYRYISGLFEGKRWQITTGSKNMAEGIKNCIKSELNIDLNINLKKSIADNDYYDVICNDTDSILKIEKYMYSNSNKLYLLRKFKSFLKLKNLIKLDKQINDIVDASMKIEG